MIFFEALLIRRDTGEDFVTGPVSVLVRTGRGTLQAGLGEATHIGNGLWEYVPDDCEIGPWKTVVLFVAEGAITGMDKYAGIVPEPTEPPDWTDVKSISRADLLAATAGMEATKDSQHWLLMLTQADPVPLTTEIRKGLQRAYPFLKTSLI
jgi:hypothetical protein